MSGARLQPWQLAGLSPMRRTMAWLRARGYVVAVVERWVPGSDCRRDCFGRPGPLPTLAVVSLVVGYADSRAGRCALMLQPKLALAPIIPTRICSPAISDLLSH